MDMAAIVKRVESQTRTKLCRRAHYVLGQSLSEGPQVGRTHGVDWGLSFTHQ